MSIPSDPHPVRAVSLAFAVIPFGDTLTLPGTEYSVQLVVADIGVGVLWVFAMTGLGVYGIILAGWSSSNHYAFMGCLRSSAQLISCEKSCQTFESSGASVFSTATRCNSEGAV